MRFAFFLILGLVAYTYIFYPALLFLLTRRVKAVQKRDGSPDDVPMVTVVVAAYNEERNIEARIGNVLGQDYPADKLSLVIASDGSTDDTNEIVRRFVGDRVVLRAFDKQRGRAAVHNEVCESVEGDVIVFSDADTVFEPDFILRLSERFSDPSIGCGAGELTFVVSDRGSAQESEGVYWSYERRQRLWESSLGVLPFASGACLAVRRELVEPIDPTSDVDNVLPLKTVLKGYKVFYEPRAKAYDSVPPETGREFKRRVRVAGRSMRDILIFLGPLAKSRKLGVLWSLFSHRLLRWWSSFLLLALLPINAALLGDGGLLYKITFACQLALYAVAVAGLIAPRLRIRMPGVLRVPLSFAIANLAFLLATVRVLSRRVSPTYRS